MLGHLKLVTFILFIFSVWMIFSDISATSLPQMISRDIQVQVVSDIILLYMYTLKMGYPQILVLQTWDTLLWYIIVYINIHRYIIIIINKWAKYVGKSLVNGDLLEHHGTKCCKWKRRRGQSHHIVAGGPQPGEGPESWVSERAGNQGEIGMNEDKV